MSASLVESLRSTGYRGDLHAEHPLAPYTTWRIGGPAQLLASPADSDDLVSAVRWAAAEGIPWRVLGNGSNLLVRDEGVRGLVLHTRHALDSVHVDGGVLRIGAGASFPVVANLAAARGLAGLEFAAGIPGTLGGALVMNAGWHAHEVAPVVSVVRFVDAGGTSAEHAGTTCAFGYRTSRFRGLAGVILEGTLVLTPDDPVRIRDRMSEYAALRRKGQPTELPSCGSVFLKPPGDFAGRLIEEAGLKGVRRGDIQVSPKHANFFVNLGRASAVDALGLIEQVEGEVAARFGVRLEREVEVW